MPVIRLAFFYVCVRPPGLEPRTTDPKSVVISISPWAQWQYHTSLARKRNKSATIQGNDDHKE